MRTVFLSVAAACSFVSPAGAQPPAASAVEAQAPSIHGVQKASPAMVARIQALRDAHLARTAVYDRTEQAFRSPTDAERAQLSAGAPAAAAANGIDLARGGVALRGASGEMSFLVVNVQPDGSTVMSHADTLPQRPAFARPIQLTPSAKAATPSKEVRHAE